jgi:hypothetical protein
MILRGMKQFCCVYLGATFFLMLAGCSPRENLPKIEAHVVSEREAIQIANREAVRLGYDVKKMSIEIDQNNSAWRSALASVDVLKMKPDLAKRLQHRDYWAIHYAPNQKLGPPVFGGELFVFVDKQTGDVIAHLMGQ